MQPQPISTSAQIFPGVRRRRKIITQKWIVSPFGCGGNFWKGTGGFHVVYPVVFDTALLYGGKSIKKTPDLKWTSESLICRNGYKREKGKKGRGLLKSAVQAEK